ncbi:hypothetical protein A2U01_0037569, partial [Trifolium medium]|nr:hypothetical protein [Trifolium medium]
IKDVIYLAGTPWLKYGRRELPTKISLTNFKPVARAWGEFFVKSIVPTANSSEYQVDNAAIVKMIIEGTDFDLGNTLCASIRTKANQEERTFSLGHYNLITALCRAKHVPEYHGDEMMYSIKALSVSLYRGYTRNAGQPSVVEADDNGGDSADEMNQFEDGTHPQQQPPQVHHSDDDIAALMTQLAIAEACNVPHIFYSDESALYQAAKARRATYEPPPVYPAYPTRESL